jgi:hypothetical protein
MGILSSSLRNQFHPQYVSLNSSSEPLLDRDRERDRERERERDRERERLKNPETIERAILDKISKMESDIINLLDSQKNLKEYVNFLAEQNTKYEKEIIKLNHNQTIISEILSLEQYRV